MVTAQRPVFARSRFISAGRSGPFCHCMLPAARKSLVLEFLCPIPPIIKTPTELRVTTAEYHLGIVRFPILVASQCWLLWSRTRQEAVSKSPNIPPQVAMTGLIPDVKNVACSTLSVGRSGGEQPGVLGKTSTEETGLPDHAPDIPDLLGPDLPPVIS